MITGYAIEDGRLRRVEHPLDGGDAAVWFDLLSPTDEEERRLEAMLGINVPTPEEMEEIEDSSRLYVENDAVFMTASLLAKVSDDDPTIGPVTFILTGGRLVTLRYQEPKAFKSFPLRAEKLALGCTDGETVLLALLDAIVDRLADILEKVGRDIQQLSRSVFRPAAGRPGQRDYRRVLKEVGRQGDLVSNVLDSLVSLERMIVFLGPANGVRSSAKEAKARMKSLARDIRFLTEHASFLAQKITFLLDATLGMIGIEQNAIIKIFSVAAVIFLPPTLVASIYGMNFAIMPELQWAFGYPFALVVMVASAVLSFWFFKTRGWL